MAESVLVVDDDPDLIDFLREELEEAGFVVEGVRSGEAALSRLRERAFDLVITDIEMPGMRGVDLVSQIVELKNPPPIVVMTAFGSIQLAVQCLRSGACDFVTKPFDTEVLLFAMRRALDDRRIRREVVKLRRARASGGAELVTKSAAMRRVLEVAKRASNSNSPVLLSGESGVGKGAVAHFIHDQGPRAQRPFVSVNCAALPAPLFEAELFGAVRGAYTDAVTTRPGLIQEANGGSLLLDEIGELPLESQPKLLHALETRTVRSVGATRDTPVDVRYIAATNVPLEHRLRKRLFRPDLYYRLNVIAIEIPPLRERREDIEALVDIFLTKLGEQGDSRTIELSPEARRWLMAHPWPGNVRQLFNLLERAITLTDHDKILVADLESADVTHRTEDLPEDSPGLRPLADVEADYIRRVLDATGGNVSEAARTLGIDRRTLQRKISRSD